MIQYYTTNKTLKYYTTNANTHYTNTNKNNTGIPNSNHFKRLSKSSCSNCSSKFGVFNGFPNSSIQYQTLLVRQHSL